MLVEAHTLAGMHLIAIPSTWKRSEEKRVSVSYTEINRETGRASDEVFEDSDRLSPRARCPRRAYSIRNSWRLVSVRAEAIPDTFSAERLPH
eukprot:3785883-Rhodomonas_salina.1